MLKPFFIFVALCSQGVINNIFGKPTKPLLRTLASDCEGFAFSNRLVRIKRTADDLNGTTGGWLAVQRWHKAMSRNITKGVRKPLKVDCKMDEHLRFILHLSGDALKSRFPKWDDNLKLYFEDNLTLHKPKGIN